MTSRSEEVGRAVLHGIDVAESGAHHAVASGAALARNATRSGSRKAHLLRRGLEIQSAHLQRTTRQAVTAGAAFARRNPWTTVAIISVAAAVMGAMLRGRQHRSGFFGARRWI